MALLLICNFVFYLLVGSPNFRHLYCIGNYKYVTDDFLLQAKTPVQWSEDPQKMDSSPACRGGFGK